MPFRAGEVVVRRRGDETWELVEHLVYEGRHDQFVVPAGFVTDFATVPRVVVWLIPRFGRYTPAAILHDWLIDVAIPAGLVTSRDTDGLFRRVMRELGVPALRRWLMWVGVRWGALANPARRAGWWRDAPAVLALSVLVAPIVAPAAVAILAGLLVYGLAELPTRLFDIDGDTPAVDLTT